MTQVRRAAIVIGGLSTSPVARLIARSDVPQATAPFWLQSYPAWLASESGVVVHHSGAARRQSSCQRVATLASNRLHRRRLYSRQDGGWDRPCKRQPCNQSCAEHIIHVADHPGVRELGFPLNNGSCCSNCWICLIGAELSTVGV